MGRLVVTFKVGLSYPVMIIGALAGGPLAVDFPTGNRVEIEAPDRGPIPVELQQRGVLAQFVVRVQRDCNARDVESPSYRTFQDFHITGDAAEAFWQFFAVVREADLKENHSLAGYPIAPSEEIHNNLMVRCCDLEWSFDGTRSGMMPLTSIATVRLTDRGWNEARHRLSTRDKLLPHVTFALDAAYFASTDRVRSIIMACASWETALKYYLANIAVNRDLAYSLIAAGDRSIPRLLEFVRIARGGDIFYEYYGTGANAHVLNKLYDQQRKYINQLPTLRNEVLHKGNTEAIPHGMAIEYVLAVLDATDWLFAGIASP
jgi:hypothetical protein